MFVVPRTTHSTQSFDSKVALRSTRGTETANKRGEPLKSFSAVVEATNGRATDTSVSRASGQKAVIVTPTGEKSTVQTKSPVIQQQEASGAGMQKLFDTFSALGMATSGLNISYSEENVGYPGGSYMNKTINVTAGGKTEKFSGDLTEKNPFVTAYEIQRYFNIGTTTGGGNGSSRLG